MPQIFLYPGVSWASLLEQRGEWLSETPGKTVCIIAPGINKENTERALTDTLTGCTVYTTEELIQHYLQQSPGSKNAQIPLLTRQAEDYLLDIIIRNTPGGSLSDPAPETGSRYLNIEIQRPGYIRALGEFIHNFRSTHHEDLLPILLTFNRGKLSAKERDLIDIHDEYDQLLGERDLFDYRRAVLSLLNRKFMSEESQIPQETLVLIGFSHLTSLDYKLLRWMISRFKRSIILACRNPKASRTTFRIQNTLEEFIKEVTGSAAEALEEKKLTGNGDSSLLPLAELIFDDHKIERLQKDFSPDVEDLSSQTFQNRTRERLPENFSSRIKITQANSRYHEVTLIARTIRRLNQENTPCDLIRVILPNSEKYTALVLEVFPRYGIPYRLPAGTPLKFYPLAGVIQSMIGQAVNPNPFPLREKIFSSPYVTFSCEVSAGNLNAFRKSIGEEILDNWSMIDALLPQPRIVELNFPLILELQIKAFKAVKSGEKLQPVQCVVQYIEKSCSEEPSSRDQKIFEILANYYVLSRAEKSLYVWQAKMTTQAFCRAVRKLFERFHIEENAAQSKLRGYEDLQSVIDQDKRVLKTIGLVLEKLEKYFLALSSFREQKFPLLELAREFSALMSDPELSVPLPDTGGVAVSSFLETTSLHMPFTILGGLVDGEFPDKELFNFLQPKREGQTLRGNSTLIDLERQTLYQIIASTTEGLFIFFPLSDNGKRLMVSPFVAEIEKCLTSPEKDISLKNKTNYTKREKLIFVSRNIDRAYNRALPVLKELKGFSSDYSMHILEVFRCDGLRANTEDFNRYDGKFQSEPGLRLIREQVNEDFVFDAGQLERYAGCSLRFLFDDLMHLRPVYLVDYHPDNTDRGHLIRRILTEYSKEVTSRLTADRSGECLNETAYLKILSSIPETLYKFTEQALQESIEEKDDFFSRRFRYGLLMGLKGGNNKNKKRPGLLSSFLDYEENGPDRLRPFLAGLSFGMRKEFRVKGLPLTIEIERVDRTSNNRYLIIYNFSISDPGYPEGIRRGLRFKLPLQILALREHAEKNGINKKVGGAGNYLIKNPRIIKRVGYFALKELQASRTSKVSDDKPLFSGQRRYGFLPEPNFEEELENTSMRVRQIAGLIQKGRFNPPLCSVKDQTCPNCQFTRICRKDQLRLDKLYNLVSGEEVYKPLRRTR